MNTDVTFSLRLNNDLSVNDFVDLAVLADHSGFDQLWLSDDLFFNSAMVGLTLAATSTQRLRVGTGILNPYTIHPAEMAMFARTLSNVSNGRFLLGVAAGAEDFLGWVGVTRDRPLSSVRSMILGLRHLLDGAPELPDGWKDEACMRVDDEVGTRVPIYVGAMSPKMLRLAGETADGVLPLLFPPERYGEARAQVVAGAESAGRDPEAVDIAACVWCSLADDSAAATAAMALKIAYYGSSFSPHVLAGLGLEAADLLPARRALDAGQYDQARRLLPSAALQLGIAGNSTEVIDRTSALMEKGATHVSFGPPLGPDMFTSVELLSRTVVPELQRF